jgi:UDP-N-acetylglucosamine/UDP-N-acetylgalactosamine 4-epimerase
LKILITGAGGFIGSNLCEFFLQKNFKVVGLDNFSTGRQVNINSFTTNSRFTFIEGDIRDFKTCLLATENIDFVLHQAALGSVPRSVNDPITSNEVNITGFLNMLEASKQNNIKRFIYASSSSTYGDSVELPKVEDRLGRPLSPYAVTKYVNELYASVYNRSFGIRTIGLRYFNVFGKKQDPKGPYAAVIPKFISQVLNGENPTINGDGSYSRDFTYVDNVLKMNYLALTTENEKAFGQVFNTAVGNRVSILEMTNEIIYGIKELIPNLGEVKINFGPTRDGDVLHSHADISKAKKILGYKPSYSFKEGLSESLDWYLKNLKQ